MVKLGYVLCMENIVVEVIVCTHTFIANSCKYFFLKAQEATVCLLVGGTVHSTVFGGCMLSYRNQENVIVKHTDGSTQ